MRGALRVLPLMPFDAHEDSRSLTLYSAVFWPLHSACHTHTRSLTIIFRNVTSSSCTGDRCSPVSQDGALVTLLLRGSHLSPSAARVTLLVITSSPALRHDVGADYRWLACYAIGI
jgi:hypothetical protein